MTSLLKDKVLDLIRDIQETTEMKQKSFYLIQITEILLHRDRSLIEDVLPEVLDKIMIIKNGDIRQKLISLAGEAIKINKSMIPRALSMFGYLASDGNDTIKRCIAHELCKSYSKIVIYIASMPPKSKVNIDPKVVWSELTNLIDLIIKLVSSDATDNVRIQILLLIEEIISFGLPLPAIKGHDPRLARQARQAATVENATDIPLEHAFINRKDMIVDQAEDLFSKLIIWGSKGGPSGHPFSPDLMAQNGSSLAGVASSRPNKASDAITTLIYLLSGDGNVCHLMSATGRAVLAGGTNKVAYAPILRDADNRLPQLRDALLVLQSMNMDTIPNGNGDDNNLLGKRGLGDDDGTDDLKASAIAAVDAVENEIKTKVAKSSVSEQTDLTNDQQSSSAAGGAQGVNVTKSILGKEGNTELASDLAEFPEIPQNLKLAQLPIVSSSSSSSSMKSDVLKLITPDTDVFNELAISSLQR